MSEEEISQLKLQRDTAIFVARERLDEIERIKNQKEIFELRYLKSDKEIERLDNIINNAIDFLKENACMDEDVECFCDDLRYDDCEKLLDILKGGSKE